MRVLVACEFTGIVREAFRARGHDAWSCDLLDTEIPGNHIKGDVLDILDDGWDLMIAHPPCRYLSYAGNSYWNQAGRVFKRLKALDFFARLWEAPIDKICIENPKSCASPVIAKYSQAIQPYFFGDNQSKTIWLWLKNLPPLKFNKTDNLFEKKSIIDKPNPTYTDKSGKKRYFVDSISGNNKNSSRERSRFFPGIAKAMADQWGRFTDARTPRYGTIPT